MAQPHNKKLGEYPMTTRGREQGPEKRYRRLRFPAFTAAKWTAANPLLQRGELGVETDTRKIKVGDGITYWNDLEYSRAETTWGEVNGDITDQADLVNFVNAAVAAEADIRSQADQQLQTNINNVAADLTTHEQDTNNPHNVTKAQVGLGNVDNTSDADKPVSTAQAAALDALESKLQSQIASNDADISNLQNNKADKTTDFETPITGTNKGATMKEIEEVQTTSIKFKGYVSTAAPASDVYLLVEGNMWINAAAMPSSFPVPASSIRVWDGSAWQTTTESYTPSALDAWSNLNNNEGYYWFGTWKVFSTDLSTEYFTLNQTSGLWEIKQSVHLSGTPTVDTPDGTNLNAIVNVGYVNAGVSVNTRITDCVIYSPKNINIGISNGTITLHAGSIVYVPNGSGTYNAITVQNELSYKTELTNTSELVCVNSSGTALFSRPVTKSRSGAGVTTDTGWVYDTDTNQISWYNTNGVKQDGLWSFPICVAQSGDDGFDYITEVFNSNGFIGNTVFALPNLEVYVPSGRKQDGTFNNIDVKLPNVRVYTPDYLSATSVYKAYLDANGNVLVASAYEYEFVNNYYRYQGNYITAGEFATNITFNGDCITGMSCKEPFALIDYAKYSFDLSDKASLSKNNTWLGTNTFLSTVNVNNNYAMQINTSLTSGGTTVWRAYDESNNRSTSGKTFYANNKTYNRLCIIGNTGIEGYINFTMTDEGVMGIGLSGAGTQEYLPSKGDNGPSFPTTKWTQRELADYAKKDLSNVSEDGIERVVKWGMPDYSAGVYNATVLPSFTCDQDYLFIFCASRQGTETGYLKIIIDGNEVQNIKSNDYSYAYLPVYVKKGSIVTTEYGNLTIASVQRFPLLKGA